MNYMNIYDIAKAFLSFESMTHKKLQKLCYYAQAWSIAFEDRLVESRFQAWIHGPVCPELYNIYKVYGWEDIPQETEFPSNISTDVKELLTEIYRIYGELDGDELENLTHSELPWIEARGNLEAWESSSINIREETMGEFYIAQYRNEINV